MKLQPKDLWTWRGSMNRGPFLARGLILGAIKYNLDRLISWHWFGRPWSLFDYAKAGEYLRHTFPSTEDSRYFAVMVAVALPFMSAGVLLTLKRLRTLQLSPWLVLLFFVPVVKLLFFALLCLLPSRAEMAQEARSPGGWKSFLARFIPRSGAGSAAAGIVFAILFSAMAVWIGTTVLRDYGWSLFVGLPFSLGFLSVLIYGFHETRSLRHCLTVAMTATAAAGLGLLLVAIEGLICLVMATPLAAAIACLGGWAAYQIQASDWWHGRPAPLCCLALLLPLLMLLEHTQPVPFPMFSVTTALEVEAPPEKVWRHVVTFSELPTPDEFIFRAGIAYPIRARIYGQGVGAERHCEFSTGAFVEPIEVWDEPRLLKFSVTKNPPPMQEWTPYADLQSAHLDGFLASRAGQFHLTALPKGRTRLEGTTWYHHHMWPETYWRAWSDYIIHHIHGRVLRHVKQLAEEA